MPIGTCPECDADIRLGEAIDEGDILECGECGSPLDVVGCDPLELSLAEEELDQTEDPNSNSILRWIRGKKPTPLGTCPECGADIHLGEDIDRGEVVECHECGVPIEVVGLDPVELEVGLDEGEDERDESGDPNSNPIGPNREYVALAQIGSAVRLVSLRADGSYSFLDDAQNVHNIVYVASSETLALQAAVEELESLINYPRAGEKDLQDFFERNPTFILNDEYRKAHPHIVLTKTDGESLIPDFALEPLNQNALCDLLELKLPTAEIFVLKKSRMRFSAAVLEAAAQLREYSMFFDEEKNRSLIQDKYGLLAFRPKMFVIIGRRGRVSPIVVRKMESDLPNLHLRTYDDLIDRVKSRVSAMRGTIYRA